MIVEASTSRARTVRSAAESVDRSAPISVGANRAVICSRAAVSGTLVSWAEATTTRTKKSAANAEMNRVGMGTF